MSHFTVMVLGSEPEKQLARYEEDTSDLPHEWLSFNNLEEEYRKKYETDTKYIEKIYHNWIEIKPNDMDKLEQGATDITITDPMDSTFINLDNYKYYNVCTRAKGDKRRTTILVTAANKLARDNVIIHAEKAEVAEVPVKDTMSWDEYMTEYCGYKFDEEQGAYGYWTNEKAKWDWYQLGGRWNGYFKLKSPDPTTGVIGDAGVFGDSREDFSSRADQTTKGNIDIEAMKAEDAEIARKRYQTVLRCFDGSIPKIDIPWTVFIDDNGPYKGVDWDERREKYHAQPALKRLAEVREAVSRGDIQVDKEYEHLFHFLELEDYNCSEDEYAQRHAESALATFAIVKDGEWYEKGEMGWWACVSNEMDQGEWNKKVMELFNSLPDDTLVSVFDCHI